MKVKITNYLPASLFLSLIANMVVGQGMVAPIRVADLNPTGASSPRSLTIGGGAADRLYFEWDNGVTGGTLRRMYVSSYDAGTGLVTNVSESNEYTYMVATGPTISFHAIVRLNLGFTEVQWKGLDGTPGGQLGWTIFEKLRPKNGVVKSGKLLTNGSVPQTALNKGDEVYSVDPTPRTATLLRDIAPGTASSTPTGFLMHGNLAYFTATNTASGKELWVSDGTSAGTLMLKDLISGGVGSEPDLLTSISSTLYFTAALKVAGNREPWTTNGTTAGTVVLKEINPSTSAGSDPKEFTGMGTKVFFSADNGSNGRELWVTDGTANGTMMVKDIIGGSIGSDPHDLVHYNKKIWFVANEGLGRTRSLFATDGTVKGTVKMLSLPADSDGENLRVCNGKLFYVSRSSTTSKMWCTDGTATGTKQVQPAISPNINPIGTAPMAVMGNWLYFNGNFDATGAELWKVQ